MQETRGYNPYKFGVVGASDSHNTAVAYTAIELFRRPRAHWTPRRSALEREERRPAWMRLLSPSGLGGVWAEENTRESIFAAMQRKETFGTSGARIKVRLFGGWEFGHDVLDSRRTG